MNLIDGAIWSDTLCQNSQVDSRSSLLDYSLVRKNTVAICNPLEIEDYTVQPFAFVSPPKWHLGHTTWFFETFCLNRFFPIQVFDERFNFVFNSYYESQGQRIAQAQRGQLSRPTVREVLDYRKNVDERMQEALSQISKLSREKRSQWNFAVQLGLHHEQQHQELLFTDIKSILFRQPGYPAYSKGTKIDSEFPLKTKKWKAVSAGNYFIGNDLQNFAYDNEGPRHQVYLQDFEISEDLVTNGEYLKFVEDRAYQRSDLWLSDGWHWVQDSKIEAPLYWVKKENTWYEYTMSGLQKINLEAPVTHVSYYEADAFARWSGDRLPTEQEWEVANINSKCSPCWQWSQSAYLSYPGYKPFDGGFVEYNGKFMSGQMVLRGGSWATPLHHYRATYRNFFQPEMRWNFTGIKLAR